MRVIGWIGVFHVFIIVAWVIVNVIFNLQYPATIQLDQTIAEAGISYYSNFPGYLGLDHGSKGLVMLLSIALPIGLFIFLRKLSNFHLKNLIALIAGSLGFAFYGLSLIIQAATVEYAFKLFSSTKDIYTKSFATLLYDWSMLEGGLSVSIYIVANLLLAIWIIIHSIGLWRLIDLKKLGIYGVIIGSLQIIGYLISWFFLMRGEQNMHNFNEAVGLLMLIWILFISVSMIRGKFATHSSSTFVS